MSLHPNPHVDPARLTRPSDAARAFHTTLPGYAPTPVHTIDDVLIKDESDRLGLPAFKILGASWAIERALATHPETHTLVAASAGNHGRAVAHEARRRGMGATIVLPQRSTPNRRNAIAQEAAHVHVIDGTYEDAVAEAERLAQAEGTLNIADVGTGQTAHDVIDGYATLFAEAHEQATFDLILVPVGVGSLGAAAARYGAAHHIDVIGVEPTRAACATTSIAQATPTRIATPGTTMAGMDCAEVSPAAWHDLLHGLTATVLVTDDEADRAAQELHKHNLRLGQCGAAPFAAWRTHPELHGRRPLLVATEGPTA